MIISFSKMDHSGIIGPASFEIHPPVKEVIKQLFFEGFGLGLIMLEFITECFVIILVGQTLVIDIFDVSRSNDKDQSFFELFEIAVNRS